jgi:hypothetical protein
VNATQLWLTSSNVLTDRVGLLRDVHLDASSVRKYVPGI